MHIEKESKIIKRNNKHQIKNIKVFETHIIVNIRDGFQHCILDFGKIKNHNYIFFQK